MSDAIEIERLYRLSEEQALRIQELEAELARYQVRSDLINAPGIDDLIADAATGKWVRENGLIWLIMNWPDYDEDRAGDAVDHYRLYALAAEHQQDK